MNKDNCFYLGYFSKAIGHKGEIALRLDVDIPSRYKTTDLLFVQINKRDQTLVPFSLEHISIQPNGSARLKMEGVNDASSAKNLVGKEAYLPLEALPPLTGSQFYFHEIIGFSVVDQEHGNIGTIQQVLEHPQQSILEILHPGGKEILIPINDHVILEVDRSGAFISVETPDGLIELYLND